MDDETKQLVQSILASLARHALTVAATWLVAKGIIDPSLSDSFVSVGIGLLLGGTALGWSWAQKHWMVKQLNGGGQ